MDGICPFICGGVELTDGAIGWALSKHVSKTRPIPPSGRLAMNSRRWLTNMTSVVNPNTLVLRLAKAGGHFLDVVKLGGLCHAEDGMQILEPLSHDSVVGEVREVPSLVSLIDPSGGRPG